MTPSTGNGQLYSEGLGQTQTGALWLQDAWKIVPNVKLTLGGRLEDLAGHRRLQSEYDDFKLWRDHLNSIAVA